MPVGPQRYELYCEIPDEPEDGQPDEPRGFFRRLFQPVPSDIAEPNGSVISGRRRGRREDGRDGCAPGGCDG